APTGRTRWPGKPIAACSSPVAPSRVGQSLAEGDLQRVRHVVARLRQTNLQEFGRLAPAHLAATEQLDRADRSFEVWRTRVQRLDHGPPIVRVLQAEGVERAVFRREAEVLGRVTPRGRVLCLPGRPFGPR